MQNFTRLKVWDRSHKLTVELYRVTMLFPREELYGLTSQIRRASSSIPANIAEGCGRQGNAELSRFLYIAMGSASELQYHLLLAKDLNFLADNDYQTLSNDVEDVKRMLTSLIGKLKTDNCKL